MIKKSEKEMEKQMEKRYLYGQRLVIELIKKLKEEYDSVSPHEICGVIIRLFVTGYLSAPSKKAFDEVLDFCKKEAQEEVAEIMSGYYALSASSEAEEEEERMRDE